MLHVEAQEAVLRKQSAVCDQAESPCDSEECLVEKEESLVESLMALLIWGNPVCLRWRRYQIDSSGDAFSPVN